ncbi:putative isoflavone reductase homolog IRL [Oryza sativa Japonica Group]|uniref:Isoflavone reductase homolog IRL n=1 Tax=Oryza sativa subsp. japonica TaxID=39947 RepID=Q5NAM0_ORYSJ|nr:putative isoflavone reductase homolog IRL [Oryza sativa Japonica Group]BAD81471.1 putative isoflavone reductase homolog IRL [Oryza sativa Japonica Group]
MASSRILVIGGTGRLGRHLVTASLDAGHPTAVLVRRPATAGARADSPVKAKLTEELCDNGARLVYGDVNDHDILVAAIKNADVVICAVGHTTPHKLVENQIKIMEAIRDAGNVKMLEPARSILGAKLRVREALRASGIPHTIVCGYLVHGFLLPKAGNPEADGPPREAAEATPTASGERRAGVEAASSGARGRRQLGAAGAEAAAGWRAGKAEGGWGRRQLRAASEARRLAAGGGRQAGAEAARGGARGRRRLGAVGAEARPAAGVEAVARGRGGETGGGRGRRRLRAAGEERRPAVGGGGGADDLRHPGGLAVASRPPRLEHDRSNCLGSGHGWVTVGEVGMLVSVLEKKIGRDLEKCYVPEEELAIKIEASPFPLNFQLAIVHSALLPGVASCGQTAVRVEATELYPDMEYVTVEEYFDSLI